MKKKAWDHALGILLPGANKILLKMKLTLCIILISFLGTLASESYSQTTKLSLDMKNTTVKYVLGAIEDQSDFFFLYSEKIIDVNREVSIEVHGSTIEKILDRIFADTKVDYTVKGRQIVLTTPDANVFENTSAAQQQKSVSGKVTDSSGSPLPGVSVVVKGTTNGTISDANGNYSMPNIPVNATLQFSFVGMKMQEIVIGNKTNVNVGMEEEAYGIEEVVAVGYGIQKKRDVTGAITSISAEKLKVSPATSADQSIQGRVAGVQVVQSSGAPGGAVQVRIRGVNSTAGSGANQPLYVVDGVPLVYFEKENSLGLGSESSGGANSNASSPLNTINPNDIESMEVLKDASATAIYGARAANGVVIITTKSGKAGKTSITLNTSYGVQSLRYKIPVLNAREYVGRFFEWRRNRGTAGGEGNDIWNVNPFLYPDGIDWQDEVFRSAPIANYNLGINGGNEKITYSISGDYSDQQGIVINTYSKRAGLRVNLDVAVNDKLKFGTRTNINKQWENGVGTDEYFQSDLNYLTTTSPVGAIYDATGNFAGRPNTTIGFYSANPVADIKQKVRKADRHRIISNMYAEFTILPDLKFKSSFGIDYLFTALRQVSPTWVRGVDVRTPLSVSEGRNSTSNWIAEQTLSYSKRIGAHSFNGFVGFSAQQVTLNTLSGGGNGSLNNELSYLNNNPGAPTANGGLNEQGLVSQFARVNYSLKDKYLLTATVRRDGSSRFGSDRKYGWFPSASIGWRVSEESFLKNSKAISNLKLRASYGSTGNQNISDYLYASLMGGQTAVFGNNTTAALAPYRFQNNTIHWERNDQMDIGFELGLFNNRVSVVVDYYDKTTNGLLGAAPLSVISGVGNSYTSNIGKIKNSGLEFALNTDVIRKGNFNWNLDFNISTNKNEVVSLGDQPFINGASVNRVGAYINRTEVGHAIGEFYLVQTAGQYKTWEEAAKAPLYRITNQPWFGPGDFIPVDQNNDKIIDDNDRVWSGSPFPDFFGGITSTVNYKSWAFTVFAPFQYGNKIWNQPFLTASTFEGNVWRSVWDDRYNPSYPNVTTAIPIPRNNNPIMPVPLYLQDGSFLRIRTISLSYDLPGAALKKIKIEKVKLYVQANNFFVFTKYQGWDPEVNSFGSNVITNGIDIGAYPQAKSIIIGTNIVF